MAATPYTLALPPRAVIVSGAPPALANWADFWRWVNDLSRWLNELLTTFRASVTADGYVALISKTVAELTATAPAKAGLQAYASNGRKNGEGAGLGTGVMVFSDATTWRACDTGQTVAA